MNDIETIAALARVIACFKVKQEEANKRAIELDEDDYQARDLHRLALSERNEARARADHLDKRCAELSQQLGEAIAARNEAVSNGKGCVGCIHEEAVEEKSEEEGQETAENICA